MHLKKKHNIVEETIHKQTKLKKTETSIYAAMTRVQAMATTQLEGALRDAPHRKHLQFDTKLNKELLLDLEIC